jgi:hypothetical protein
MGSEGADFSPETSEIVRDDSPAGVEYVRVYDESPEGYDGTCLRPLGLCELGGCCDACWYNPDHPRFHTE